MKLKFDENGNPVIIEKEGLYYPVYEDEDGKEIEADVPQMYSKIVELGSEAKQRREKYKELENKFKVFADIEDIEEWKTAAEKAMETVKNFNDKQLVDAGKVDEIKKQMKEVHKEEIDNINNSHKAKYVEYENQLKDKEDKIYHLMVSSKFAQSPLFSGKDPVSTLPPEIAETYFGKNFKVEEGNNGDLRVTGYVNGNPIYSRKNPGELADFDEALEAVVDAYPLKDRILRSSGAGSGASGGSGDGGSRDKSGIVGQIEKLQTLHKKAMEEKDGKLAVSLKNRIHDLRNRQALGEK